MIAAISSDRAFAIGGNWTPKFSGVFQSGDPSITQFSIEGMCHIKELGGNLKAFFQNVKIVKRQQTLNKKYKEELLQRVRDEEKRKKAALYGDGVAIEDDDDDDDDEKVKAAKQEKEEEMMQALIEKDRLAPVEIPNLKVFLIPKKPKTRMVDAHTIGTRLVVKCSHKDGYFSRDGAFGIEERTLEYTCSLKDIPESIFSHSSGIGIVVLKLPEDPPASPEPLIYCIIRLQPVRNLSIRTGEALHIADIGEKLSVIIEEANEVPGSIPKPRERVKALHLYQETASKCWAEFQLEVDEEVDFEQCFKMLDVAELFMIKVQAKRLFDTIDLKKSGKLGIIDFETLLIAYDALNLATISSSLILLDVFDSFKKIPFNIELQKELATIVKPKVIEKPKEDEDEDGSPEIKKNIEKSVKQKKVKKYDDFMGIDYSSFCEGIQMLGTSESNEELIREAFCFGGGIRVNQIESKYLDLIEFRKGWIKICDMEKEMTKRKLKFENGAFAQSRNRDRLNRIISDFEDAYLINLSNINEYIEKVKHERREKRDAKKREKEAFREKLLHEANKFIAIRAQEKRLLLKQEQEEKSKKRLEEKVLKNKLLLRQQENEMKKRMEVAEMNAKNERLRLNEIKALGLDKLDLSVQKLRYLPKDYYESPSAQIKLSYLIDVDMSRNLIDKLPDKLLYWMNSCRKLKLSQNRLKRIPHDIEYMSALEILEIDSNLLDEISEGIGKLTSLQKLNLASNHLKYLPNCFELLGSLRYLNIHSNHLTTLPTSIKGCFKLDFIDLSNNHIEELPLEVENLVSLVHINLTNNRVGHLPPNIGELKKLQYFNISTNILEFLPDSFSSLESLEYCNLENNSIHTASYSTLFHSLKSLKLFNAKTNSIEHINKDIGNATNLTQLDLSCNNIKKLPLEFGMLVLLQDLKLTRNNLEFIPPELGACIMLQSLDLSYNSLSKCLPDIIGLLENLTVLDISFNDVESLPRSIIGLKKLIDMCSNQFTDFPIELNRMKSLSSLNLSNNMIELLPRNINMMTNLQYLDLSKNRLRCLPVEFTDILESVSSVEFNHNPWSDLPIKWGKLWSNQHSVDGAPTSGYNVADVCDFLYAMKTFYNTAELIWEELGVFYYSNRLGLDDFIQELRVRLPRSWHEGLVEYVKFIYFTSVKNGFFVRWYATDLFTREEAETKQELDRIRREKSVIKSRNDNFIQINNINNAYEVNTQLLRSKELSHHVVKDDHDPNEYLRIMLAKRDKEIETKRLKRERKFEHSKRTEFQRLQEILDADKEGRDLSRRPSSSSNVKFSDL